MHYVIPDGTLENLMFKYHLDGNLNQDHLNLYNLLFVSELLKSVDLSDLFNILKPSLQILTRIAKDLSHTQCILNSLFHKLVQISSALYGISDFIQIPLDFCQFLIFLVSIPWLSIFDPPWSDLPNKFGFPVDTMASTGAMLSPVVHTDSKDTCLHLLAAFPSDAAPTWRSQVFLSVLVCDDCLFEDLFTGTTLFQSRLNNTH